MGVGYYDELIRSAGWNHNVFHWNIFAYRNGLSPNTVLVGAYGSIVVSAAWNLFARKK